MNKDNFIKLIQQPSYISMHDLEALEEMVRVFPYCSLAHMLIAKHHYDQADMLASQKLRKAAAYSVNRETLKKMITGERSRQEWTGTISSDTTTEFAPQPEVEVSTIFEETSPTDIPILFPAETQPAPNAELLPELDTPEPTEELTIDTPPSLVFEQYVLPLQQPSQEEAVEEEEPPLKLGHLNDDEQAIEEFSRRVKKNIQREIIESFIRSEPRISALNRTQKESETARDLSEKSIRPAGMVSENLANIFIRQGKVDKAVEMFEKLILKYPEKKAYFAGRIEDLKQL